MITIPTYITMARMVLIPFMVMAILSASWYWALFLFVGAVLSDILDGFLARSWNNQTVLGEMLDPFVDKIMLLSCFCALATVPHGSFVIPVWFLIFLWIKESVLVFGFLYIRFFMHTQYRAPATFLGKLAGPAPCAFIVCMIVDHLFLFRFHFLYYLLLIACVISSLMALGNYCYMSYKTLVK